MRLAFGCLLACCLALFASCSCGTSLSEACGAGETRCGDRCVDRTIDPSHCGACDKACAEGEVCAEGACVSSCAGELRRCDGGCVDWDADPAHCGGCDRPCAAGETFACAATRGGPVYCWGRNTYGQLGNGETTDSPEPVEVQGLRDVLEVSAGDNFACALDQAGKVWCWGWGASGRLGNGSESNQHTPGEVQGMGKAVQIGAGLNHACALKGGEVWCWGWATNGQAGNGDTDTRRSPTKVEMFSNASAVATGGNHSCVLVEGEVWCAGNSLSGQVGNGAKVERIRTHEKVPGLSDVVELALGHAHSCARKSDGQLFCWGRNDWGQVGDGSLLPEVLVPEPAGLMPVHRVSSLFHTTCALSERTGVWCWGRNNYGQLASPPPGLDPYSSIPVPVRWSPEEEEP